MAPMFPMFRAVSQLPIRSRKIRKLIQEAIQYHIEFMREHGDPIPPSTSLCEYVEVEIPEPAVTGQPQRR